MTKKLEFMEDYEYQVFKKWQDSREWHPDVFEYNESEFCGPGFVYGDMSVIESVMRHDAAKGIDYEAYVVTIDNIIQEFDNLQKAEEYLWKWHAKDNCHTNYDDLSHLSTVEEVK